MSSDVSNRFLLERYDVCHVSNSHITAKHSYTISPYVSRDVCTCIGDNTNEYAIYSNGGYRYNIHSKLCKGVCCVVFNGVTKSIQHTVLSNSKWSSHRNNNHEFYQRRLFNVSSDMCGRTTCESIQHTMLLNNPSWSSRRNNNHEFYQRRLFNVSSDMFRRTNCKFYEYNVLPCRLYTDWNNNHWVHR